MELPEQNEWQVMDKSCGCLYPWYTKDCLDFLSTQDYSQHNVLEYGSGYSTIWWTLHAKYVRSIDSDINWNLAIDKKIREEGLKADVWWTTDLAVFRKHMENFCYLRNIIVIIDGIYRDECCRFALELLPKGSIIICDNWDQQEVWEPSAELIKDMTKLKHTIYKQDGHPHWKTAIFIK